MSEQQHRGAVIGPSIQIDGTLKGDEDLLIQGKVEGTIELKKNSVTVGESGEVKADIFAHSIVVEGQVEGKIVGSERLVMRKTARVRGTLIAPRVMLEDGARFNGTIDMDPEAEAIKSAFAGQSTKPNPPQAQPSTASAPKSGSSPAGSADRS
ncbi:bactofilin family protein [Wenzhouxiangella limi]|uniref:Polymer-forming cytoskeletal protein n=2 Tax=Chromatiales TaxID=135613 RepID=A0A845UWI7_9GAMM|nr:polymer-forming cytoskeletal protein [Wenzhouxiangella limi]NDY94190.1 polymer-forming cytoskeletal protein [Wenzhouxiangella limi]TQE98447.1 MAG: polymer-forming cytoskeletal protein [Spiribacter salinus]